MRTDTPTTIDIAELVGRPGQTRDVELDIARAEFEAEPGDWGPGDEALESEVEIRLVLEMLVDGLLARGRIAFATSVPCARCLAPVPGRHRVEVYEMFLDPGRIEDDDDVELEPGYELDLAERAISVEALVRDAIVGVLPVRMLCSESCQGLCSTCGADLNTTACGHDQEDGVDPRWGALADLELPPG